MKYLILSLFILHTAIAIAEPRPQMLRTAEHEQYLVLSNDEKFAVIDLGDELEVWSLENFKKLQHLRPGGRILGVAISPDGRYLAEGNYPRIVRVYDLKSGHTVFNFQAPVSEQDEEYPGGLSPQFSADSKYLLTTGGSHGRSRTDPFVRVWSVDGFKSLTKWKWGDRADDRTVRFAPSAGTVLKVAGTNLASFDPTTGKKIKHVILPGEAISFEDGEQLRVRLSDGDVAKICDYSFPELKPGAVEVMDFSNDLQSSRDGKFGLTPVGYGGPTTVYSTGSGQKTPLGDLEMAISPSFSNDGKSLFVITNEGLLVIDLEGSAAAGKLVAR